MIQKRTHYVTSIDYGAEISRFTLIGLNGVTIFQEERDVSSRGWQRMDENNQMALVKSSKTLIVHFPMDVSHTDFLYYERYTDELKKTETGWELVMLHDSAFSRLMLNDLEQKGYIKRRWKTFSKTAGEYPLYVNPTAWQVIFNIGSVCMSRMHQFLLNIQKKEEM